MIASIVPLWAVRNNANIAVDFGVWLNANTTTFVGSTIGVSFAVISDQLITTLLGPSDPVVSAIRMESIDLFTVLGKSEPSSFPIGISNIAN